MRKTKNTVLYFLCDINSLTLLQIACVTWERRRVCHITITSAEFWIWPFYVRVFEREVFYSKIALDTAGRVRF